MKPLTLVISDEAVADLVEIWVYIAEDSPEQADRFVDRLRQQCEVLAGNPLMGRDRSDLLPGVRAFPVGHHLIFYRLAGESLQVVRVLEGHRDLDAVF